MTDNGPYDRRSKRETEAEEAAALRENFGSATRPLDETVDEPVEPRSALDVQGDLPGLDDNSDGNAVPGWDKARAIADEKPVGAGSALDEEDEEEPAAHERAAAFRNGDPAGPKEAEVQVRPAGPGAMRSKPRKWDEVDEAVDESFPASDPAAKY